MSGPTITALARLVREEDVDDAVQLLDERQLAKLDLYSEEIDRIGRAAMSKPLASDMEEARAVELVSRGLIALKDLDGLRHQRVDPLNAEVKAVNGLFGKVTGPLEALVGKLHRSAGDGPGRLEKLILAYRAEKKARLERERLEAERKQREAAEREEAARAKLEAAKTDRARQKASAEMEAASRAQTEAIVTAPAPMMRGVRTDSGSVAERTRWVFTVVKPELVPREYLCPDEKAIRAAVSAGERAIPGVAITEELGLTRRTG